MTDPVSKPRPCPGDCGRTVARTETACGPCLARVPRPLLIALTTSHPLEDVTTYLNARGDVLAWFAANPLTPTGAPT